MDNESVVTSETVDSSSDTGYDDFDLNSDDENERTIFCSNLDERVTEELLYEIFLQSGPIEKVSMPRDSHGRRHNYGFITYIYKSAVPYALDLYEGLRLYNKEVAMKSNASKTAHSTPHKQADNSVQDRSTNSSMDDIFISKSSSDERIKNESKDVIVYDVQENRKSERINGLHSTPPVYPECMGSLNVNCGNYEEISKARTASSVYSESYHSQHHTDRGKGTHGGRSSYHEQRELHQHKYSGKLNCSRYSHDNYRSTVEPYDKHQGRRSYEKANWTKGIYAEGGRNSDRYIRHNRSSPRTSTEYSKHSHAHKDRDNYYNQLDVLRKYLENDKRL